MNQPLIDNLQDATKAVKKAATPDEKAASLDHAFELFQLETEKLAKAYFNLQKKFESVQLEAQDTNLQLKTKIQELDFASNYLENILNQMSQGLLFVDVTGIITTYNRSAEILLGKPASSVHMQSFWNVFPDELFGFSMRRALGDKTHPLMTFTPIEIGNTTREIEVDASFLHQERTPGLIILLRDITELRRLQSLAARHDRLKELGEMAAMVAHEIRNPLGGIKGFASLLERDLKESPELAKMAGYIIEGTDTLNRLVSTVLNYSRPIKLQMESMDVINLMDELVEHVQADPSLSPKIKIITESQDHSIIIPTDSAILKGAVLNLIVNSIQAMPDGGVLTLNMFKDKDFAVIQVKDTGIGIPPENLKKLYSPFFTTRTDGNGFGLAEVYKVVQAHGGTIEADSVVGIGTTFTMKLPLHIGGTHGN